MKQTAVQWLVNEYFGGIENCTPDFRYHINKAIEMEKEQMMDAYHEDRPFLCGYETGEFFEQYYKETYETQETN
jgi:hypothetical protein